jgi:predicted nuclease of restriction endonuclease-like (RecB) superfamily
MILKTYKIAIKELKSMILASRYRAAALANRELLVLYFAIGKYISDRTRGGEWGTNILDKLSTDLQKELPGLRGFSSSNLRKMRLFYEAWAEQFLIRSTSSNKLEISLSKSNKSGMTSSIRSTTSNELKKNVNDQFENMFLQISLSHHSFIISKVKTFEERKYYVNQTALEFWSLDTLENKINSNYYKKQGKLPNNFSNAIANDAQREKALQTFKDEYLLDFINIEDPDIADEKEFENEIVRNIRKFILSIGTDFAFIGNQYRLVVEDEESFVDLLFYNRKLQILVAFELKKGKFKPEYLGKMNFYLSALDEMVKQPHENPSIGIILCKSKTDKIVEFSFRDFNKAMGVATYKTSKELPAKYKGILPDAKALKKLL